MKYIFLLSFILNINLTFANNSVSCDFEEVYDDGSTQFGYLYYNDGLLRYEYIDKQLFTIIYNNDYFVIRNDDQNIVSKLENDDVLNELKLIIENYPNIKNIYNNGDVKIKIQNSLEFNFLKRISINSNETNLSIYFINCGFENIPKNFFQPFALTKIKK